MVELCRFATTETEARLIAWALEVSSGAIRRRGDLLGRVGREEAAEDDRARRLAWWWSDGGRFGMEADLPAFQGAVVAAALERMAAEVPTMPDEEGPLYAEARRDALLALCMAGGGSDPDLATVVIHVRAEDLASGAGGEVEGGPVVHASSVERLLCSARTQVVAEDRLGDVVGLGRATREPSSWMRRQVRYRDRGCRFPGCGARRFTQAHHVTWLSQGGRTDLDNLLLMCTFHHRLVHEHRWTVERSPGGEVRWARPEGIRYRAGPAPALGTSSAA